MKTKRMQHLLVITRVLTIAKFEISHVRNRQMFKLIIIKTYRMISHRESFTLTFIILYIPEFTYTKNSVKIVE